MWETGKVVHTNAMMRAARMQKLSNCWNAINLYEPKGMHARTSIYNCMHRVQYGTNNQRIYFYAHKYPSKCAKMQLTSVTVTSSTVNSSVSQAHLKPKNICSIVQYKDETVCDFQCETSKLHCRLADATVLWIIRRHMRKR